MKPTILFRSSSDTVDELLIAEKYFDVLTSRTKCNNNLVVGRYSVLPYYKELVEDLSSNGSILINSYANHSYIANMVWLNDLEGLTPQTWDDYNFPNAPEGRYVVKGKTNSRKFKWDTEMFAHNKKQACEIANTLAGDSLIGPQSIVYRKYIPLVEVERGINQLPFTMEFRFFFYRTTLLTCGYYWSIAEKTDFKVEPSMVKFANMCAEKISDYTNFFVLDIAIGEDGHYHLIEVNDGQMSGLSECNPDELYSNLRKVLNG